MIHICNNSIEDVKVRLEFGEGDICIAGGTTHNESYDEVQFLAFQQDEAGTIGRVGKLKKGPCMLGDFPVILTFSNVESVVVLMEELEKVKKAFGD